VRYRESRDGATGRLSLKKKEEVSVGERVNMLKYMLSLIVYVILLG
jgi:hypothetical protein